MAAIAGSRLAAVEKVPDFSGRPRAPSLRGKNSYHDEGPAALDEQGPRSARRDSLAQGLRPDNREDIGITSCGEAYLRRQLSVTNRARDVAEARAVTVHRLDEARALFEFDLHVDAGGHLDPGAMPPGPPGVVPCLEGEAPHAV